MLRIVAKSLNNNMYNIEKRKAHTDGFHINKNGVPERIEIGDNMRVLLGYRADVKT